MRVRPDTNSLPPLYCPDQGRGTKRLNDIAVLQSPQNIPVGSGGLRFLDEFATRGIFPTFFHLVLVYPPCLGFKNGRRAVDILL